MNQQPHPNQGLPRSVRLRRQRDFDVVWKSRRRVADRLLVVHWRWRDESGPCRIGLSVGKRLGNAVVRNRWKRLIREAFRRHRSGFPYGLDLVVRPQAGRDGAAVNQAEIEISLLQLVRKIRPPHRG